VGIKIMTKKKKAYDMNSPEAKAVVDEIVHGTFLKEGTAVAFPLCFPAVTVPIPADESLITALDAGADGTVYGGTSGRAVHLFVGMFHGVTGIVFDVGVVEGADHCAAICCGRQQALAFVNGPDGGKVVSRKLESKPFDLLQEWSFNPKGVKEIGSFESGERIIHAAPDASGDHCVGITDKHLFIVDIENKALEIIDELEGRGKVVLSGTTVIGLDEDRSLWSFDIDNRKLSRKKIKLPEGSWTETPNVWAKDPTDGTIYTVDDDGRLFSFTEKDGFTKCLGKAKHAPVTTMTATLDGRIFGFCGDGISRLFCYDPHDKEVRDLGVAVSVIERRRYGYQFADAVVGRDGQIYFAEDDNLGHLWIYFPSIQKES